MLMTTRLLEMQSLAGFRSHQPGLHHANMSNMAALDSSQDGWTPDPRGGKPPSSAADYFNFPMSSLSPFDSQFQLDVAFEQKKPLHRASSQSQDTSSHGQQTYADFASTAGLYATTPALSLITPALSSSSLMFTAANAPNNSQDATTISPLATRFDPDDISPESNGTFAHGERRRSSQSSKSMQFTSNQQMPTKRRRDSLQTNFEVHSPSTAQSKVGRRRKSEFAEPGSARAVYLEKNRKAASKCRSKQKMQQEELVETAREVERRNRALKAEVELLKGGMRELMDIVGQHTDCPDSRLRTYMQREADRLASGGTRTAPLSLSLGCAFPGENVSPKSASSSDRP